MTGSHVGIAIILGNRWQLLVFALYWLKMALLIELCAV